MTMALSLLCLSISASLCFLQGLQPVVFLAHHPDWVTIILHIGRGQGHPEGMTIMAGLDEKGFLEEVGLVLSSHGWGRIRLGSG